MANYKKHTYLNVFMFLPLSSALLYFYLKPSLIEWGFFIGSYIYSTLLMNPDLDLIHQIKWNSIRGVFSFPFFGYSKIFKHRGISHKLVIGSLTRILWVGIWITSFFVALSSFSEVSIFYKKFLLGIWKTNQSLFIYSFSAICLSDSCHILVDFFKK